MADNEVVATLEEPLSEEERQIEGYHTALHALFKGTDDIIVAQSVAVFMGCVMAHSEKWMGLIPGFVQHVISYANAARAAHLAAADIEVPTTETSDGSQEAKG